MNNWKEISLGDALQFQRGFDITKKEQKPGEIPIVSSSGITSYHNQWKIKGPGVVIGRKGTLGTTHYIPENYWPHDTTLWIKNFKGNNPRFLYYFLQTMHLENFDTGSSNPTLNRNHLHKIKTRFPKLPLQKKIAAILSAYDDMIENNKSSIVLLEKMSEEIYREWFVRMRFPGHEKVKIVKGVPENWEYKPINNMVNFLSGYPFKSEKYVQKGDYGIITIKNVHDGYFLIECSDYVDDIPSNMPEHCFLKEGNILISLTGNVGRVCIVFGKKLLLNQRVAKLKTKDGYGENFVYWFFRQKSIQTLSEYISTGAAQQNLSPIKFGNQKVFIPSRSLLDLFEIKTREMKTLIITLEKQNLKLQRTKDKLLIRLISGKLLVDQFNIQFPPSMQEKQDVAHA